MKATVAKPAEDRTEMKRTAVKPALQMLRRSISDPSLAPGINRMLATGDDEFDHARLGLTGRQNKEKGVDENKWGREAIIATFVSMMNSDSSQSMPPAKDTVQDSTAESFPSPTETPRSRQMRKSICLPTSKILSEIPTFHSIASSSQVKSSTTAAAHIRQPRYISAVLTGSVPRSYTF